MARVVKKPEERRKEIVRASRALFLKSGYENTTMQDVMTKLKIAKGTAYYYFKSKEELLDAVVEDMVDEYIVEVEKAIDKCPGNALDKMRTLVEAGRVASEQADMLDSLHHFKNMTMHGRLLAVTITRLAPLYAKLISKGCKEGLFEVKYPLECAEIFIAGVQFVTDRGCYPWDQKTLERRTKAIPVLLERLLNAPKNSFKFLLERR